MVRGVLALCFLLSRVPYQELSTIIEYPAGLGKVGLFRSISTDATHSASLQGFFNFAGFDVGSGEIMTESGETMSESGKIMSDQVRSCRISECRLIGLDHVRSIECCFTGSHLSRSLQINEPLRQIRSKYTSSCMLFLAAPCWMLSEASGGAHCGKDGRLFPCARTMAAMAVWRKVQRLPFPV